MISDKPSGYQFTDELVDRCATCIERSKAVDLIEQYYNEQRGDGGRRTTGRTFTLLGFLTVGLALCPSAAFLRLPRSSVTWAIFWTTSSSGLAWTPVNAICPLPIGPSGAG